MIGDGVFIVEITMLAVQVYISWAVRQRSRSCKVLMIMNYTLPALNLLPWIIKAH